MENVVERKEIVNGNNTYRISVYYDEYPLSVFEDFDTIGKHYYWTGRWGNGGGHLGNDYARNTSEEEVLIDLIRHHIEFKKVVTYLKSGKDELTHLRYDKTEKLWHMYEKSNKDYKNHKIADREYQFSTFQPWDLNQGESFEELLDGVDEKTLVAILEHLASDSIYVKSWSWSGYSQGEWADCLSLITKKDWDKMTIDTRTDTYQPGWEWKNVAEKMDGWIEMVDQYLRGDVYRFVVEKEIKKLVTVAYADDDFQDEEYEEYEWREIDSCGSYYGDLENVIKIAAEENNIKL